MKGYIYTLEVVIAISILLLTVALFLADKPEVPDVSPNLIKRQLFDAAELLENNGTLRQIVLENNTTMIKSSLLSILPENIFVEADICSLECNSSTVSSTEAVVSVDYYLSGYDKEFFGKKVKLWAWREF
jgi:hypothetical protein